GASTATARGIAAGAVGAYSRASTTIRGEIMASGAATNMAIKGNEFFVGRTADGQAVYTRRGDFSLDGEGYLTNGAGTRLGSGTGFIQVDRAEILPPKKSTTVDYQINLPSTPMPKAYDPKAPASGLLPP